MSPWVWVAIAVVAIGGIVAAAVVLGGDDGSTTDRPARTDDTDDTEPDVTTPDVTTPDVTTPDGSSPDDTVPAATVPTVPPGDDQVAGAPAGSRGDRNSPVPAGQIADIGGGFRLQVLDAIFDATAQIAAENEFNDPPPSGSKFTLVRVALGYYGTAEPTSTFGPTFNAFGASGVELDTDCGSVPDALPLFSDVFAGGVVTGNLCYVTTAADDSVLQLSATGTFFGDTTSFLAVAPPASPASPMPTLTGPRPGGEATPLRLDPIGIGTATDVGGDWTFTVDGPARDITTVVTGQGFNDPPPDGFVYVGVDVSISYAGSGVGSPFEVTTHAVGSANVEVQQNCGFFDGELEVFNDVVAGATVSGLLCFVAPQADTSFVLYVNGEFSAPARFFATS